MVERRHPEVAHQHDLARGVAGRRRDDRRADAGGRVVEPEPAGEQPVAVGVLENVLLGDPAGD